MYHELFVPSPRDIKRMIVTPVLQKIGDRVDRKGNAVPFTVAEVFNIIFDGNFKGNVGPNFHWKDVERVVRDLKRCYRFSDELYEDILVTSIRKRLKDKHPEDRNVREYESRKVLGQNYYEFFLFDNARAAELDSIILTRKMEIEGHIEALKHVEHIRKNARPGETVKQVRDRLNAAARKKEQRELLLKAA